jgi:ubiquinol-cytochrome c reductase cytochrome b subunit
MLAVMAVVLGVILVPAARAMLAGEPIDTGHLGAELGAPADPSLPYAAARPEWYFLFLFQFLKVFEGWGATGEFLGAIVVPGLIMTVMFLMPIVGRWNLGHRFNVAFTLGIVAGAGLLTALALNEDYYALWVDPASLAEARQLQEETGGDRAKIEAALGNDPARIAAMKRQFEKLERVEHSEAFLAAVRQAKADAARAVELAGRPERIPPAGMLELVRTDPKSQGPLLFAQHCASCHPFVDPEAPEAASLLAKSSAANLHGFGTAPWVRGLLDPEQVAGPAYFGNTAHKDGSMVDYVEDEIANADTWPKADVQAVIAALTAEAGQPVPTELASLVDKGRTLVASDERCGSCHRFRDNGTELGTACDLTGWGGRDWLVDIISDPTHERFYAESNDRMPSFGKAEEGASPMLRRDQIELIADWLRGTWYRSAAGGHPVASAPPAAAQH